LVKVANACNRPVDEPRVKRLLVLPQAAEVVMVIAAGRGAVGGVIPQIRFGREHYIKRA
jgi:hypothetical protein